jgi:hypothetical protein
MFMRVSPKNDGPRPQGVCILLLASLRDGASAGFNGDYYSRLRFDRYPSAQTKSSSRDGLIDALVHHVQLPVS